MWTKRLMLLPQHTFCWRILLLKSTELPQPLQLLRCSLRHHSLPYQLPHLPLIHFQPLPQLPQQSRGEGQLSRTDREAGAPAAEGKDSRGRGVNDLRQQGLAGGKAKSQGRKGLQGVEPQQKGLGVLLRQAGIKEASQLTQEGEGSCLGGGRWWTRPVCMSETERTMRTRSSTTSLERRNVKPKPASYRFLFLQRKAEAESGERRFLIFHQSGRLSGLVLHDRKREAVKDDTLKTKISNMSYSCRGILPEQKYSTSVPHFPQMIFLLAGCTTSSLKCKQTRKKSCGQNTVKPATSGENNWY